MCEVPTLGPVDEMESLDTLWQRRFWTDSRICQIFCPSHPKKPMNLTTPLSFGLRKNQLALSHIAEPG